MRAFVLGMLTIICHSEAYLYRAVNCFCNPVAESEKGQGRLQITSIQLITCLRGYPDPHRMTWIYPVEIL